MITIDLKTPPSWFQVLTLGISVAMSKEKIARRDTRRSVPERRLSIAILYRGFYFCEQRERRFERRRNRGILS